MPPSRRYDDDEYDDRPSRRDDDYDRPSRREDDYDRPSRRDRYDEEDRPSRRNEFDVYDDRPSIRRRRGDCPFCGCSDPPRIRTQISQAGWIVFAVMLVVCWPLFFIGLLMNEEVRECRDCGLRL